MPRAKGDPRDPTKIKSLNSYTRKLLRDVLARGNATRAAAAAAAPRPPYAAPRYVPAADHPHSAEGSRSHALALDTVDFDPIFDCHLIPQYVYVFADAHGDAPLCDEIYPIANLTAAVWRIQDEATCTTRPRPSHGDHSNKAHHKLTKDDLAPELQEGLRRLYARDYALLGTYFT